MVLSASSVRSYLTYDDSYAVVKRQLLWVAIGLPAAWVASRIPMQAHPQAGLSRVRLSRWSCSRWSPASAC